MVNLFNTIIKNRGYTKYLEIGISNGSTISKVECELKHGVDPCNDLHVTHKMTSDKFFENCTEMYDMIFIDGDHNCDQVLRDIQNSIKHLNTNGIIFAHDTKPDTELMQRVPQPEQLCSRGLYTADAWKAIAKFRSIQQEFSVKTFNIELGLTIIERGYNEILELPNELTYEWFLTNQDYVLNLIPYNTGL